MAYLFTPMADLHPPKKIPCDNCGEEARILVESYNKQRIIWCTKCWNAVKDIQRTESKEE